MDMKETNLQIGRMPAILLGEASDRIYLFLHGKLGCKEEARAFAEVACARGAQVLGVDFPEHGARKGQEQGAQYESGFDPWHVEPELQACMRYLRAHWQWIGLRANSIGAWFAMQSFADGEIAKCLFVSPILDMNALIANMMRWANVSAERLQREQSIQTDFGETLSWEYYTYAKRHPITDWKTPTAILYAGRDNLTDRETLDAFARAFHADVSVMPDGEHWFHTPEQLRVLRDWEAAHA